ncbi:hypothetical protein [Cryobacterium sp. TMB1-7]|uniref:hypothetical protein n=1 Tax=Cryobacterium sp. TMB1-7 TaxID=2555866 RepID=UPI00106B712C|nr:hypothetical protein [Cryobacterium sp. TMB1-7]TFC63066.1 hypothetical protein E3O60_00630 [Cryobacterium sp. TMB1-7]
MGIDMPRASEPELIWNPVQRDSCAILVNLPVCDGPAVGSPEVEHPYSVFCLVYLASGDPFDSWLRDERSQWAALERNAEIQIEPTQGLSKRDMFEQKPRRPEHPNGESERDKYPEQKCSRKQHEERG